jgi:shikimate dehydrogenase|tara:strand:+ start:64 stop:876 length:813 start_codon:yes stop_codon:yes gene_type:complete
MNKYAVIGNPINHSISPMIHAQFSKEFGLSISYEKILAPIDEFQNTVKKFIDSDGLGFNITLPFKIQAHHLSKDLTPNAKAAGAVNTIKIDGTTLIGENTDGVGLVNDLLNNLKQPLRDKEILIIGAGGATQGILKPILDCNPAKILLANRTKEKSLRLASKFLKYGKVCGFGLDQIKAKPVDIVINATSASIDGNIPHIPQGVVEGALCYDLMYGIETPFMKWANEHSARKVSDGLGMLVEQAALSFSFWLGKSPQTNPVIDSIRAKGD